MAEAGGPKVSTIPPHRAFVDALAAGLIARHGNDPMALARGLVLLPNNRSCRALSDAFVRSAGDRGLLLPRMVPIGDLDLDEAAGIALDDLQDGAAIPAAIDACRSEEHTSELQSLMRISYAVFCLKKTNTTK